MAHCVLREAGATPRSPPAFTPTASLASALLRPNQLVAVTCCLRPQAAESRLPGGFHGRSQSLFSRLHACTPASPAALVLEVAAGGPGAITVEDARGDPDRQRQPVGEWPPGGASSCLCQGAGEARTCARWWRHFAAAPDHGQDRTPGDAVAECVEAAVFMDLGDAQRRIGLFIDHYNLPKAASGHRRPGAGRTATGCLGRAADREGTRGGQRPAPVLPRRALETVLT